jgi:hypothetical protein
MKKRRSHGFRSSTASYTGNTGPMANERAVHVNVLSFQIHASD